MNTVLTLESVFKCLQYNSVFEAAVSVDMGGMLEYWSGPKADFAFPKKVLWEYKTDTDLYEFAKVTTLIYLFFRLEKFVIKGIPASFRKFPYIHVFCNNYPWNFKLTLNKSLFHFPINITCTFNFKVWYVICGTLFKKI